MNDFDRALELAAKWLRGRDLFGEEVRSRLLFHGIDERAANEAVIRLAELGFLDDRALAKRLVAARVGQHWSNLQIEADLSARGAGNVAVDLPYEDERIDELIRARFDSNGMRMKAARYLTQKGFAEDSVERALAEHFGAEWPIPGE